MTNVEYKYFSTGYTISLNCNCKALFWSGPAIRGMEESLVEISDKNGTLKVWNISIYVTNSTKQDALPEILFKRLKIVGDNFDLQIQNMSSSDEGLYVCDNAIRCTEPQKMYILQFQCKYFVNSV